MKPLKVTNSMSGGLFCREFCLPNKKVVLGDHLDPLFDLAFRELLRASEEIIGKSV